MKRAERTLHHARRARRKAATAKAEGPGRRTVTMSTAELPNGQVTVGSKFLRDDEVQGLLFDCDGTLIDTMPLFFKSWEAVCPLFGLKMTLDDFYGVLAHSFSRSKKLRAWPWSPGVRTSNAYFCLHKNKDIMGYLYVKDKTWLTSNLCQRNF